MIHYDNGFFFLYKFQVLFCELSLENLIKIFRYPCQIKEFFLWIQTNNKQIFSNLRSKEVTKVLTPKRSEEALGI